MVHYHKNPVQEEKDQLQEKIKEVMKKINEESEIPHDQEKENLKSTPWVSQWEH